MINESSKFKFLNNVFSREKSLIYFCMWNDSDRKGAELIKEKINNNLFIIPKKGEKGTVWYENQELEYLKKKNIEKLRVNSIIWKKMNEISKRSWEFIKPYAFGKKKIENIKEFEEYYDNLVDFWVCLNSILYEVIDNKEFDNEIRNNLRGFRDTTEKYTEKISQILTDYLESNLKPKDLSGVITKDEAINLLKQKMKETELIKIRERLDGCFMLNGEIYSLNLLNKVLKENNLELETLKNNDLKEIKGSPVFGGLVKSIVKIIHGFNDLDKINKGDILVTEMTNPKYLFAFQKASAVITDQGGSLCHAAIFSREFKLITLTQVKGATKILKDGDLVEVDADKGIIKILKKA